MKKLIYKTIFYVRKIIIYKILKLETVGVRMLLIVNKKVLLIKHQYDDFWVLPGGGVKKGERPLDAGVRELREETGIQIIDKEACKKLGEYLNNDKIKRDKVFVYVYDLGDQNYKTSDEITVRENSIFNKLEVEKQGWFELDKLPLVSKATKRRIIEFIDDLQYVDIKEW